MAVKTNKRNVMEKWSYNKNFKDLVNLLDFFYLLVTKVGTENLHGQRFDTCLPDYLLASVKGNTELIHRSLQCRPTQCRVSI